MLRKRVGSYVAVIVPKRNLLSNSGRRQTVECGVPTAPVVEGFDVVEDGKPRLRSRTPRTGGR